MLNVTVLLGAENVHDSILGSSLVKKQLVRAPEKKQKKGKKLMLKSAATHRAQTSYGYQSHGKTSVTAKSINIDTRNLVHGGITAGSGATLSIGDTDISNSDLSSLGVETHNTVTGGGVDAKGDDTRFRLGTVDIEGVNGGDLDIKTENTIQGGVSVKDGQDVSIGVVEMGTPSKDKKEKQKRNIPHGIQQMPDQVVDFMEIGQFGQAVKLQEEESEDEQSDDPNGMCIDKIPQCSGKCCQGANGTSSYIIGKDCHTIDGCSAVRDSYQHNGRSITFGDPTQGFTNTSGNWIPCNAHDQCYQTCGTNREACDIQMYYDMIDTCHRYQGDKWNEKQVLNTREIDKKVLKGFGGEVAAIAIKVPVKKALQASGYGIVVSYAASKEIDMIANRLVPDKQYFEKLLKIGFLSGSVPVLQGGANSLQKTTQDILDISNMSKDVINHMTRASKWVLNKSVDTAETLAYDMASNIESGGHATSRLFNGMADTVAPQNKFIDTVSQPLTDNASCRGNFSNILSCELLDIPDKIGNAAKSTLNGMSWLGQTGASYFFQGAGALADYGGQLLADDIRFTSLTLGNTVKYVGSSIINGGKIASNTAIDTFTFLTAVPLTGTSKALNVAADGLTEVGNLIFDCLATAETYYKGLRLFGGLGFRQMPFVSEPKKMPILNKPFRGNLNACKNDNSVDGDERCCVVNPNYRYHQSQLIQRDLGRAIPNPIDIFCNSGGGGNW